jgi:hypothetical protein
VAAFYAARFLLPIDLAFIYPRWAVAANTLGQWLPAIALETLLRPPGSGKAPGKLSPAETPGAGLSPALWADLASLSPCGSNRSAVSTWKLDLFTVLVSIDPVNSLQ